MTSPHGVIRIHQQEQTLTFQVVGWGQMATSLPVRQFTEQALAQGVRRLCFDLRHCTYLDSTFLGTLLFLQRAAKRRIGGELILVSPSPDCVKLLHQLGVEACFRCLEAEELTALAWTELVRDTSDAVAFNHNVLQAHQELAGLAGTCGETFQPVARRLEQDLQTE